MGAQGNTNFTIKNIIAIIGFIILLIIGIWSAIQVIKIVPRLFSETGVATQAVGNNIELGDKDIVIELSKDTANSGEPVAINWARNGDDDGILSFAYACEEDFYFQVLEQPIPCNAPYQLTTSATSLEITPISTKNNVEAALAITYTNTDGESVRDTKILAVRNTLVSDTATPQDSTTAGAQALAGPIEPEVVITKPSSKSDTVVPYKPIVRETIRVPRTSDPYGTADLRVEIVAVGDINPYGAFEAQSVVHQYARGAVKFKVTNLGTKQTGSWFFSAVLPTQGGYSFNSQAQQSLMPGSSTEIFMTFDQLVPGVHTFTVYVDPQNYIPEWNEQNNVAAQALTVLNY